MIGMFLFSDEPARGGVTLRLGFDVYANAVGRVIVPSDMRDAAMETDTDVPDYPMPLAAALALGVLMAARSSRSLTISGDPAAWNPSWGRLTEAART